MNQNELVIKVLSINDELAHPYMLYESPGETHQCIYSFCLGKSLSELWDLTIPSHIAYAKKTNSDYFCFNKPAIETGKDASLIHQEKSGITYNKLAYLRLLADYQKILYLDLDVAVNSAAPSIFSIYNLEDIDFVAYNESSIDPSGVKEAINQCVQVHGGKTWTSNYYFNTGVFLLSNRSLSKLKIQGDKLFAGRWSEQTYINWLLQNSKIRWLEMDQRFNTIYSLRSEQELKHSFFLHFAGMTSPKGTNFPNEHNHRIQIIKKYLSGN